MTDTEPSPGGRRRWTIGVVVVLMLLILWPLSVGPVGWLYWHGYLPEPVAEVLVEVYRPWEMLADRYEPLGDFFGWYGSLWFPEIKYGNP